MSAAANSNNPAEQWMQYWTDAMKQAGMTPPQMPGATTSGEPAAAFTDQAKQMQRTFFDAMARYCDDYMRSEEFLKQMKQSMDASLAFKKMMDDFLVKAQSNMQSPVRGDVEDLAHMLRGIEERIFDRLDRLEEKVAAVEEQQQAEGSSARTSSSARSTRSSSASRASKKK